MSSLKGRPLMGLLVVTVAGCGGSSPPSGSRSATVPPSTLIAAVVANSHGHQPDAFYVPNPLHIRVGQTITWTNKDNDLHDVTSNSGFASSPLAYRGVFRWTFRRAGVYRYFCTLHPEMHGTIVVRA